MAFQSLPRSINTNFLVVYEPYRVLEGLQGVAFQGKNFLTKMVPNFSETDFGFFLKSKNKQNYYYDILVSAQVNRYNFFGGL